MFRCLLLFVLLALSATAVAVDRGLYVYWDGHNVQYQCPGAMHTYVDWTGYGSYFGNDCYVQSTDYANYPLVYPQDRVHFHLADINGNDLAYGLSCRFVANAKELPPSAKQMDTSDVLDCRTYLTVEHKIQVHEDGINTHYACTTVNHNHTAWNGAGSMEATGCTVIRQEKPTWSHVFPGDRTYFHLFGANGGTLFYGDSCRFVERIDTRTSTEDRLDCRTY